MKRYLAILLGATFAAFLAASPAPSALAQGLGILDRKTNDPVEIEADDGIEWRQEDKVYVARGKVKVVRGEVTLYGDVVTAHYREAAKKPAAAPQSGKTAAQPVKPAETESPGGGTEIWKIDAVGSVRIESRGDQAFGDRGVYNVDLGVLTLNGRVRLASPAQNTTAYGDEAVYDTNQAVTVLTGKNLRFESPDTKITARDSLEYHESKNLAVARGEAVAVQQDKRVRADILTAHLKPRDQKPASPPPGKQPVKGKPARPAPATPGAPIAGGEGGGIQRLDAFGNVLMSSPESIARGEKGVYTPASGMGILTGAVKVTRGESQMNGEMAEVNLNTGVSRMLSSKTPTSPGQRVRALFAPNKAQAPAGAGDQMSETKRPPPPDDPARPRLPGRGTP